MNYFVFQSAGKSSRLELKGEEMKTFCEECREEREKAGYSLRDVAKATGYTHQAISAFELGKNLSINIDILLWYVRNTDIFSKRRREAKNENI